MPSDFEDQEFVDVGIEVAVVRELSILLAEDPDNEDAEDIWIPISQIKDMEYEDFLPGCVYSIEIPEWLAIEKGLV